MSYSWHNLIQTAWQRRSELANNLQLESWRIFHGYEEGAPGIVIEKFGSMAVVNYKTDIRDQISELRDALLACFPFQSILLKGHQSLGLSIKQRMFAIWGEDTDTPEFVQEEGIHYHLLANTPHNVGLYLDARPVRTWLRANAKDRRILNLFAFTGSLGIAAYSGGAKEVIHLDKSRELLPRIRKSYAKNGFSFNERNFLRGDIYKHLPRAIRSGQRFDGIILDPPPVVYHSPHAPSRPRGQDFSQLVRYCSQLLNPNAWLLCMFHRFNATWEDADNEVITASQSKLQLHEHFNSGIDFPEDNPNNKLRVSVFTAQ